MVIAFFEILLAVQLCIVLPMVGMLLTPTPPPHLSCYYASLTPFFFPLLLFLLFFPDRYNF